MGSEWRDLQRVAYEIDRRLKGGQPDGSASSKFRTLVHGDVKSANILFSDARQQGQLQCALYDLQVGQGKFAPHATPQHVTARGHVLCMLSCTVVC